MENTLLQYGALGVLALVLLIAVRLLFQREVAAHDWERARGDRLETELRNLNEAVQGQYLTTLTQATLAISEALKVVREMQTDERRRS